MIKPLFLLGDVLERGFVGIILTLDTLIYGMISSAFKIFMAIAGARLLSSDAYYAIANKVYLIIGVLMLFVLSYAILKAIVNPDEGSKSFGPGLIKRIVIAVVGLAIAPALFNFMYQVQGLVLEHNVLGKIFFRSDNTEKIESSSVTVGGQSVSVPSSNPDDYINVVGGSVTATTIWQAFFYPAPDSGKTAEDIEGDLSDYYLSTATAYGVVCAIAGYAAYAGYSAGATGYGLLVGLLGTAVAAWTCSESVSNVGSAISHAGEKITLAEAYTLSAQGESFGIYTVFIDSYLEDGEISYLYGISTIAGAFTLYAFVSFSIDMGVRAAKLAYYQIIAPVPLIMQVLPGKGESTFKEYTKGVIHTFLEVFIRIAVVYIVVYIICHLQDLFSSVDALWGNDKLTGPEVMLAMAFLIIGLIIFCKDAPKFLGKTLGIDGGNLNLGIRDKLSKGGALTAAAAVGGGVTAGVNNLTNRWGDANKWKDKTQNRVTFGSAARNLIGGVASGVAGTASGAVRGGVAGKDAKHYRDVVRGISHGAQGAKVARENREEYADVHDGLLFGPNSVAAGRIQDMGKAVIRWAGINDLQGLEQQEKALTNLTSKMSAMKSKAKSVINGHADGNKKFSYDITASFDAREYDNKNRTNFAAVVPGLSGVFSTATYKTIKDGAVQAEHSSDGKHLGYTVAQWRSLQGKYEADFADEVQNIALKSQESWDRVSPLIRKNLGDVRDAAEDFRSELSKNIASPVIEEANKMRGYEYNESGAKVVKVGPHSAESLNVAALNQDLHVNGASALNGLEVVVADQVDKIRTEKRKIRARENPDGKGGKGGSK